MILWKTQLFACASTVLPRHRQHNPGSPKGLSKVFILLWKNGAA